MDNSCQNQLSVFMSRNSCMALMVPKDTHKSSMIKGAKDAGKYVRYTAEQVQALERLYNESPKPSSLRRQQLLRENPILQNIEPKQIKVWFQNRRCREKQRKETSRLQTVNAKITAINKLLLEENDRLQKQVAHLVYENGYIRQQLQHGRITTDTSWDSIVTSGLQHLPTHHQQSPMQQDGTYSGIMSLAEETLAEFLGKATGTTVDWIHMPGMKPGPDSTSMINISHGCAGVAAQASGLVNNIQPAKILEVIKDKPLWQRDCRCMTTMFSTSTGNGGFIEVLYVQMYAPTTLNLARDFYTLRYTTLLEDGSYVVCERSLNGTHAPPMAPQVPSFVRGEVHASGCLIRPCEGAGSVVIIIHHMDLEPWSVPEILRPLYESSGSQLPHKLTIAALKHLRHIAQEAAVEAAGGGQQVQAATVRSLSHRLVRGFNDAVNGFADDGWAAVTGDGRDDVTILIKPTLGSIRDQQLNLQHSTALPSGILCAKASMLLQNVRPAFLVRFLREHRSEWADKCCNEALPMGNPGFSGFHITASNSQLLQAQVHAIEEDEFLELIKIEGQSSLAHHQDNLMSSSQDMFLLQVCSGLEENDGGACAQMVFAPINASIVSDDIALLPSGFRVIPLDYGSPVNGAPSSRTLDLASTLEVGSSSGDIDLSRSSSSSSDVRSVLTIAFQFSCNEIRRMQDSVASIARQHVRNVVSTVQRVACITAMAPLRVHSSLLHHMNSASPAPAESLSLARCICTSYKMNLGVGLVQINEVESNEAYLQALTKLGDAVMCCSCKSRPLFIFANQAGLDMLEMSSSCMSLQELCLEKTLVDEHSSKAGLCTLLSQVMQQGYACLPAGIRLSSMGRPTSYDRGIAWKVMEDDLNKNVRGVAFLYVNWSLV